MIRSRLLTALLLVVALLSMAACSKKNPTAGNDMMGANGDENAETYGMPSTSGGGFAEQGGTMGGQRHVNALTAPANQVYYFDFDQDSVQSNDLQAMNIQAKYIASHPSARVRLEGNTDNRGSREYNVALGWRRAQAVAHILEQQGVAPNQIVTVSYGKERPVADGDNEQAWSLNRRVELIYENQ